MNKIIFATKPIDFARIHNIGFSLDNVLVYYKQSCYALVYELTKQQLVENFNYPQESLAKLQFQPHYASAAYVVDPVNGTAMQIDEFQNITACVRGHQKLSKQEYTRFYPERSIKLQSDKYYVQADTFSKVFVALFLDLIQVFAVEQQSIKDPLCNDEVCELVNQPGQVVPQLLFGDIRQAFESIINDRQLLLEAIKQQPEQYIKAHSHLKEAISKLKSKKNLFILTDVSYEFADFTLQYIYGDYKKIFDYLIFNTTIQSFESSNLPFRRYQSYKYLGGTGKIQEHEIYCQGNFDLFTQFTGFKPNETLYCCGQLPDTNLQNQRAKWHYCIIQPSISREAGIMTEQMELLTKISALEAKQTEILVRCGLDDVEKPEDLKDVQAQLVRSCQEYMDCFGIFGSKYQTSWALTKLGDDIIQKSDMYTNSVANFYFYSCFHYYNSSTNTRFLPHQMAITDVQDSNQFEDQVLESQESQEQISIKIFQ